MRDKIIKQASKPSGMSGIPVRKRNSFTSVQSDQPPANRKTKCLSLVSERINRVIDKTFLGNKAKPNSGGTVWLNNVQQKGSEISKLLPNQNPDGYRNAKLKKSHSCSDVFESVSSDIRDINNGDCDTVHVDIQDPGGIREQCERVSKIPLYTKKTNTPVKRSQSMVAEKSQKLSQSKIPQRSRSVTFNPMVSEQDHRDSFTKTAKNAENLLERESDEIADSGISSTECAVGDKQSSNKHLRNRSKSCHSLMSTPHINGKVTTNNADPKPPSSCKWRRSKSVIDSIPEEIEDVYKEFEDLIAAYTSGPVPCEHERNWENVELKLVDIKPSSDNTNIEENSSEKYVVEEIAKSTMLVCRHPNCMEANQERPYLLCNACDKDIHALPDNGGHLVFDLARQRKSVGPTLSNELQVPSPHWNEKSNGTPVISSNGFEKSTPNGNTPHTPQDTTEGGRDGKSHSDNEIDHSDGPVDDPDGVYIKKGELDGSGVRASKFKRKKVLKARRHHTDDEPDPYVSGDRRGSLNVDLMNLMTGSATTTLNPDTNQPLSLSPGVFSQGSDNLPVKHNSQQRRHSMYQVNINNDLITVLIPMEKGKPPESEIVAATRNTTLRDAIFPLLDRRKVDLSRVSVFLDSSHTALPWNCELFLLGGKSLHIKDKDGENVLRRVKPGAQKIQSLKHYRKHHSPTRSPHSSTGHHGKFRGRALNISKNEHPLAQADDTPPSQPHKTSSHLPHPDEKSIVYIRPGSVSEPEFYSDDSSDDDHDFESSQRFRKLLLCEVKNEHPMARNHIQRGSLLSSQRSRRANNLSWDDGSSVGHSSSPQGSWSAFEKKPSRPQTKLQQLFNPLNKDKEKQEQLNEILTGYSVNGLPGLPDLMRIPGQPVYDDQLFQLEGHWSSLVANASSLTKRQHDQQEAIWELLQTEVQYIKSLKVITELFTCVLLNLQQELLLNEIETEKLFSNINQIYLANCKFWKTFFLTVLESSRETRKPLDPSLLKEGFKKFADNFRPYTKYCLEQKPCLDYMKARFKDNELFKTFVVWAEAQKQCNRLKLTDLLVKPMQRLTKYSLLLQAVLRKTDDDKQRRAILEMIGNVDRFVTHVNAELRKCHERERLAAIIGKIESYDAVEPPNDECKEIIQQYNDLNLWDTMPSCNSQQPRCVIIQSGLKMKDAQTRVDVECMLFTDMLLICKASKRMDKFKVIKPPMRVDRILVQELKDRGSFLLLYLNEYRVPVTAFTFHSDTASIQVWIEHIKKAQDLYNEAKMASLRGTGDPLFSSDISSTSPNSPSSFLGESLDKTSFIHQQEDVPVTSDLPPSHRPRAYTVGGQDPDETDEVDFNYSSRTLPRDVVLPRQPPQQTEAVHSDKKVSENSAEEKFASVFSESKHQPMSLPLMSVHSVDTDEKLVESVFHPVVDDEAAKLKLNQRRTSRTERRYHTADSIRELERRDDEKDAGIHKRLSWNLGMVDISIDEKRINLKNKAFSSDSLRSVPSSSGVSSTGSLHLSPESEISEESETNSVKAGPSVLGGAMSEGAESPLNLSMDVPEVSSDTNIIDMLKVDESVKLSPEDKYAKSKSTSDIANIMGDVTRTKMQDGISSVELPKMGTNKKKLSYSQMLLVKKQLLLSSDLEASEV